MAPQLFRDSQHVQSSFPGFPLRTTLKGPRAPYLDRVLIKERVLDSSEGVFKTV